MFVIVLFRHLLFLFCHRSFLFYDPAPISTRRSTNPANYVLRSLRYKLLDLQYSYRRILPEVLFCKRKCALPLQFICIIIINIVDIPAFKILAFLETSSTYLFPCLQLRTLRFDAALSTLGTVSRHVSTKRKWQKLGNHQTIDCNFPHHQQRHRPDPQRTAASHNITIQWYWYPSLSHCCATKQTTTTT